MEGQDCESTFTLEDAIDSIGFGQFQMLILLYAGISWMAEAMEMMLLSFVGPAVQSLWNLTPKEQSFISSVVFGGMMIGAYSWGILSDLKGRRVGFFVTAVVTFIAGFLSALSPDYYSLLFCRAIVGVGLGGGHVVSSWFLEFVPSPHRGQWMVVFSLFWTVGSVLEASLAWVVMPKLGWRWLLGFSSLPLIILLAFYPLVPESPWYFTAKGETSKALEILQKMAMVNKKELPAGRLISQTSVLKKDKVVEAAGVEMVQLLPLGPPIVTADVESRFSIVEQITSSLLVLVSPPLVSSTLLLWFVFFTNAFTYYGLVLLTSQLSSGYTDCAAEIGPKSLLRKDYNNLYRDVFITSLAELPGLATAAAIVDRYGRKYSMAGLLGLCSVFLLPLVQHQTENVTTFLLFGARACIMGSFTILYIYTPELYPTRARSTGLGVANSFSRIGGLLCPLIAVGLVESCQQALAVLLFTVVPALACFAVLCFPLETKGRALSDSIDK